VNLLEQYIEEVHDVRVVVSSKEYGYVVADLTVNCYGSTKRQEVMFPDMDAWELARAQGYYWG
jgi:hypothetical protein